MSNTPINLKASSVTLACKEMLSSLEILNIKTISELTELEENTDSAVDKIEKFRMLFNEWLTMYYSLRKDTDQNLAIRFMESAIRGMCNYSYSFKRDKLNKYSGVVSLSRKTVDTNFNIKIHPIY